MSDCKLDFHTNYEIAVIHTRHPSLAYSLFLYMLKVGVSLHLKTSPIDSLSFVQDMALQNELRLASLRHLTLATNYAQRAKKDDLVLEAASDAWNVSLPLVPVKQASVRRSLFGLQRQIVDNILACSRDSDLAASLRQQFYLAMIDEQSQDEKWDAAYVTVQEAFDRTPSALQKPLWKWRVIVMSKLGKNVLDGIQKLKENDPSLQVKSFHLLSYICSSL